ncbi:MAG: hypothetical protein OHK0053_17060 [Microscillaceae bacterium]
MHKKLFFWGILCFLGGILGMGTTQAQKSDFVLVIDPGHGGSDPGKPRQSRHLAHEKDVNLAIALKLGQYIRQNLPAVQVIFTREKDEYVSLEDRVELANRKKADCFISIHANASNRAQVHGTETHIYSRSQAASLRLATLIEEELRTRAGRPSRGILDARERGQNLYVTQYTRMPSVLVETGYLTHPKEEAYLNTANGQALIASAIFRALRSYCQGGIPPENRQRYYRVQVLATSRPVDVKSKYFDDLEEKVVELINPASEAYRYKYLIGHEFEIERARALQKKVAQRGFKDAFVVSFED